MHKWLNKKVKRMDWIDIKMIKWSVFFMALLIAKIWPAILSLRWQWYLALTLLFMIRPIHRVYLKTEGRVKSKRVTKRRKRRK